MVLVDVDDDVDLLVELKVLVDVEVDVNVDVDVLVDVEDDVVLVVESHSAQVRAHRSTSVGSEHNFAA